MKDYFPEKPWACKCGCGYDEINPALVDHLNMARDMAKTPFIITSACRCEDWNKVVGGSPNSEHTLGNAVDIAAPDSPIRFRILRSLIAAGFTRIGVAKNFIHVDVGIAKPQDVMWLY